MAEMHVDRVSRRTCKINYNRQISINHDLKLMKIHFLIVSSIVPGSCVIFFCLTNLSGGRETWEIFFGRPAGFLEAQFFSDLTPLLVPLKQNYIIFLEIKQINYKRNNRFNSKHRCRP